MTIDKDDIYYKIVLSADNILRIAEMQWFDEYDYTSFSDDRYVTREDAVEALAELYDKSDELTKMALFDQYILSEIALHRLRVESTSVKNA